MALLAIALIAALAGVMNSIAGGGTLLTFPALIAFGLPPINANATSTVALWPGSAGSAWGYRGELEGATRWAIGFAAPSLVGGLIGAILLLHTPPARFDRLVPWLVLAATFLFIIQRPAIALLRKAAVTSHRADLDDAERTRHLPPPAVLFYQLLVAIYGGYFGAGAGILMLAVLGFIGLRNIHRMNGLKNLGGMCINIVAAVTFMLSGVVRWPAAGAMAIGAVTGGYLGSRIAQRVPQSLVRGAIIAIGLGSGLWLLR